MLENKNEELTSLTESKGITIVFFKRASGPFNKGTCVFAIH